MTLDEIKTDWTRLGAEDPLWAVLVAPGKRRGRWNPDDFLATGRREVDDALATLARFAGAARATDCALDFGCGVGRLTQALAAHYEKVIGVDISEPMLDMGYRLDRTGGRCLFLHNETADLSVIPDESVDLVFTSLVFQHIPPALTTSYIREFGRVVKPGGRVCVLMPTSTRRTVQGLLFEYAPHQLIRTLQRHVLRYPAPMRMHTIPIDRMRASLAGAGLSVIGTSDESGHGSHWNFTRFYAVKPT